MAVAPLTHHEILALVEPFARGGRAVDLAASRRAERQVAFRAVVHEVEGLGALTERLQLEHPRSGRFVLTRLVSGPLGLEARLVAGGDDAGELLARIDSVAPAAQFARGTGWAIAYRQSVQRASARAGGGLQLIVDGAAATAGGLLVRIKVSSVQGIPAELDIAADADVLLPEDLLAVLGWSWKPLRRVRDGWKAFVDLKGDGPKRSADAQAKLVRTLEHLAHTLAEPPARFHERHRRARWGVVGRRLIPLLGTVALVAGAAGVARLQLAENSIWRMLIFHAPPLLLAGLFCLRELPRIEIPPLPRRSPDPIWPGLETACSATR
jgi:hypothetical protein